MLFDDLVETLVYHRQIPQNSLAWVKGVHFTSPCVEDVSLGQPVINMAVRPLRSMLYGILGMSTVNEYGADENRMFSVTVVSSVT